GIRDFHVTGVQTCALPILSRMLEGGLTTQEFENMFFLFAVAGNETLRNGIPGGLHTLLDHPSELARLRADPSLLPSAVEEMLRYRLVRSARSFRPGVKRTLPRSGAGKAGSPSGDPASARLRPGGSAARCTGAGR